MRLESNIYFYLVIRVICVINCLIVLFCVALSSGWTSRFAAIIGLIFTLVSLLFVGGAIATLFVWNLANMSLAKRSIFVFVFILTSIVSGVMYLIAPTMCDSFNQYGCFQTYYSGAYKVAAAFSFISVGFSIIDVILNFFFYYQNHSVVPVPSLPQSSLATPSPSILKRKQETVIDDEEPYLYPPRLPTGHSTEV